LEWWFWGDSFSNYLRKVSNAWNFGIPKKLILCLCNNL
jgi:hypothetical protein